MGVDPTLCREGEAFIGNPACNAGQDDFDAAVAEFFQGTPQIRFMPDLDSGGAGRLRSVSGVADLGSEKLYRGDAKGLWTPKSKAIDTLLEPSIQSAASGMGQDHKTRYLLGYGLDDSAIHPTVEQRLVHGNDPDIPALFHGSIIQRR